jgi:rubrerythrin
MFRYALKAEAIHAELYKKALQAVQAGTDLEETEFYLCPVCGHIEFGKPTEACPTCGAKAESFMLV